MADPQPYQISYSFAGFQANSPSTPLPAASLDNELANIQTAISGLVTSVTDVRRSDGALKNGIVTLDAIHESVRTAALSPVSNWEADTAYGVGQVVIYDGSLWSCAEAHTSGDDFDEDEGEGLWEELAELPTGPQGPAATITVGTVTTGAAGTDVIIVNAGTSGAAVLNFTIPRGDQGIQGNTGAAAWAAPEAWQTGTAYTATAPRSVVTQGGETYVCLIAHTSGTFSTDLAASRWIKVAAKGADGEGTGDVTTTGSVTAARLARYADTSGDVIEDAGVATSTDGSLTSDSDAKVPTEKAVKSYVDAAISAIRNGVSASFDTLAEIATELGSKISTSAIGSTVQAYDADTAKLDVAQTWTAVQSTDPAAITDNTTWSGTTGGQIRTCAVNGSDFDVVNPSALRANTIYVFRLDFTTTHTVNWGTAFEGTLDTSTDTAGAIDYFFFIANSAGTALHFLGSALDADA